jgi:hypothetical protein
MSVRTTGPRGRRRLLSAAVVAVTGIAMAMLSSGSPAQAAPTADRTAAALGVAVSAPGLAAAGPAGTSPTLPFARDGKPVRVIKPTTSRVVTDVPARVRSAIVASIETKMRTDGVVRHSPITVGVVTEDTFAQLPGCVSYKSGGITTVFQQIGFYTAASFTAVTDCNQNADVQMTAAQPGGAWCWAANYPAPAGCNEQYQWSPWNYPSKYTAWTFTWYCGSQWCSVNKVSGASAANYNGQTWVWFI